MGSTAFQFNGHRASSAIAGALSKGTSNSQTRLLAITLCLSLLGYQVLAPWFQLISPEGSVPGIVFRLVVITLCLVCVMANHYKMPRFRLVSVPVFAFLTIYTFRLAENFFVREFVWKADPFTAMAFLIGGAIIPAFVLQRLILKCDDQSLVRTLVIMSIIFLVGLALNWDSLLIASQMAQASLDKLNPIGLGFIASSLALFFVVAPFKGVGPVAGKYVLLALLIGVTIFSKSRGPVLATLVALFVYGLFSTSQDRRKLIRALAFIGLGICITPFFIGTELFLLAFDRFATMGISDSSKIDASSEERVVAWDAAWAQFLESPIVGDKVFEPSLMHYPHNLFLESLISLGMLGTFIVSLHIFICSVSIVRIFRRPNCSLVDKYIALIAIKEFVAVQVSSAVWNSPTFWIASACVIGIGVRRSSPQMSDAYTVTAPAGGCGRSSVQ